MNYLILIRHGASVWNHEKRFTSEGEIQNLAEACREREEAKLAQLPAWSPPARLAELLGGNFGPDTATHSK